MTRNQRIVLLCGLGFALLIGLFPPWRFVLEWGPMHATKQAGYFFITSPPELPHDDSYPVFPGHTNTVVQVRLDFERLEVEWITLVVAASFLLLLFKRKPPVAEAIGYRKVG
jgi:hypothetical protein